jgi:hypothetical protein
VQQSALSTVASAAPGRICSTATCAVAGGVRPTASCAAPLRVSLQEMFFYAWTCLYVRTCAARLYALLCCT